MEVEAMVNKDQLDQTGEGQQVLALLAKHFTADQFQPALTLIEQRYTEDETVWDAELNSDSKLPFLKTNSAHRLLVFFASPSHLAKIVNELAQREAEHPVKPAEAPARKIPAAKHKAQGKIKTKVIGAVKKARGRKAKAAMGGKKKPLRPQRSKAKHRRPKVSKAGRDGVATARRAKSSKLKTKHGRK
jgi:hypothetical protein